MKVLRRKYQEDNFPDSLHDLSIISYCNLTFTLNYLFRLPFIDFLQSLLVGEQTNSKVFLLEIINCSIELENFEGNEKLR